MNGEAKTTIEDLFLLKGADRDAKAYAFLYAAFKRTEISANPVRDALDCLIPFIAPYTNQIAGKQVTSDGIQSYLRASFGFEIPLYAIDQLVEALEQQKFVEYRKNVRAHFAVSHESKFDVVKSEIETEFDDIASLLEGYARTVGFNIPPPSGSWGNALITFLRVRTDKSSTRIVKVKNVLLDPTSIEMAVVGGFIRKLHDENDDNHFNKILNIFMGVLIEDFISSVASIGQIDLQKPVTVFYDTAVLLRQLGCSGKMFRTATEELTRYLQDLGFQIRYFSGNEAEVSGIIDTIVYIKDAGKELEGETAAAMAAGEVSTSDLRMLQNAFPERLAAFNIFPAGNLETDALANAKFQIDERGFSDFLFAGSHASGKPYSQQNRQNDAGFLASVMRLRRGNRSRDLADCGFVFVTSNRFLASASRRYLIEQRSLGHNSFPPIVALGQIATIAWLLKDQSIPPEKAGRELLTNCFAAVKPDAEWFGFFREGMEKVAGPLEDFTKQGKNALTLQAARRIAQDESFGNSAIVKQLNMAEILSRAEQEQNRADEARDAASAAERLRNEEERAGILAASEAKLAKTVEQAEANQREAVRLAREEAQAEINAERETRREEKAGRRAGQIVTCLKLTILALSICVIVYAVVLQGRGAPMAGVMWVLTVILAIMSMVAYADLLKFSFMDKLFLALRNWISKQLLRFSRWVAP